MTESTTPTRPPGQLPWKKRALLWVRKTHMYLGLFLFPWVVFFGLSGMLFNHPGMGEDARARPVPAALLREHTGLRPIVLQDLTQDVVRALNHADARYRIDPDYASRLSGSLGFEARGPGVNHLLLVDLPKGRGLLLTRPDRTPGPAPFATELDLAAASLVSAESHVAELLPKLGVAADEPLKRVPGLSPSLRFRMIDQAGTRWNVTYDLGSGRVDGRPTDRATVLSLHDVLGSLHKTHHFPPNLGPTTFWALLADLTGLTLVIWALTGLVMWWQVKRTRALGVVAVSLGLLVAAWTMLATDAELRFGNVRPEGPGGK